MTSRLFWSNSVGPLRRFQMSSTAAIDFSYFPVSIAVEDIAVWQNSKISVLFMSAIKSCDSLLNLLIFCVWLKSSRKDSFHLWFSNSSINFLPLFSRVVPSCSTAERRYSRNSVVHSVVTSFSRNFSNRLMVPKMILRLGFVNLVDRIASSI